MGYNFPSSPANGQTFSTPDGQTYVWDGVAWRISNTPYASGVVISDTPPANPFHGMLWWEADSGNTFIWYEDGDSGQWVQFNVTGPLSYDKIFSTPQDMLAGFKTGASFVVNDKADGSGTDVFQVYDYGGMVLRSTTTNMAAFDLNGAASGANASSSGILRFNNGPGVRKAYIYFDGTANNRLELAADAGNMLLGTLAAGTVMQFMTSGATQWTINNAGRFYNWTGGAVGKIVTLYTGGGTEYGIVLGTGAATGVAAQFFSNSSSAVGSISVSASATAFNTTSDERLKDFIGPYDPDEAIRIIRADPVREFTWKVDGKHAIGWGAQTSYEVDPDLATRPEEGADDMIAGDGFAPWGVDQGKRTPYLWAALTRALDRIDELETRLAALEGAR